MYHDLVNRDGSFNRSVVMKIAHRRALAEWRQSHDVHWFRAYTEIFDNQLREVWGWAKAQRRAEFEWKTFKPRRAA